MTNESIPIWQHHGIVNVAMQDGSRERACMCQLTDEDVTIVEGRVDALAEKDEDCPHRDGPRFHSAALTVDGEEIGGVRDFSIGFESGVSNS